VTTLRRPSWSGWLALGALGMLAAAAAGCSSSPPPSPRVTGRAASRFATPTPGPMSLTLTPTDGSSGIGLDQPIAVSAVNATISGVSVTENGTSVTLDGTLSSDRSSWQYQGGLQVDTSYVVTATATNWAGSQITATASFHTIPRAKRLLTTVQFISDGATVGVGMPIDLHFNVAIPPAQQQGIIDHIAVVSNPSQPGGWHWFDDQDVHYRPESFWQSGTTVTVVADLNGVDAGNGYWGLGDWSQSFTVGAEHVTVVNVQTRTMQVYDGDPNNGGQLLHTWSTNTGKPGFDTIGGTLIVLYHTPDVLMDSCSTFHTVSACTPGTSNYYHENVYEDTAVSTDGYFIHAAPWVCGQNAPVCDLWPYGNHNTSHGCINLSVVNATTYYTWSQVGDVVEVIGSPLQASYADGQGDWQTPWSQWVQGGQDVPTASSGAGAGAGAGSSSGVTAAPSPTSAAARP
jgi:lipoprotein-anchoring transpeptidase ErfK/SrfK